MYPIVTDSVFQDKIQSNVIVNLKVKKAPKHKAGKHHTLYKNEEKDTFISYSHLKAQGELTKSFIWNPIRTLSQMCYFEDVPHIVYNSPWLTYRGKVHCFVWLDILT